ncbi:MAG: insulinase family protein [Sphingobium sp.]
MNHSFRRSASSLALTLLLVGAITAPLDARVAPHTRSAKLAPPAKAAAPKPPERPWLYANSDVPIDTAWTFGTLPNGLRYAVRRNGVPPGQVSIRLRIDAGSLMEHDNELGFAHYMEHLTFRGSKYVPDGESKRIWQRLGVTFGSDSNAQTTPTGTTYALDLPQADAAGLDESFKILSGMMTTPNIVPSAVDAERAVVLAEMRESTGPDTKVSDASRALFFAGQPLATHNPIGTAASLNAATASAMQAFHDRWYRPENAVISIAGDIDPADIEVLIKKYFAPWKGGGPAVAAPDFGKPNPGAPTSTVVVQPGTATGISLAWLRPWLPKADTIAYNQRKLTDMVALQIINRRLEQAARAPGASFLEASVNMDDISRSVDGTFVAITPAGPDWEKALNEVRAIIEDARTTAPTDAEIAREYVQFDTALAIQVENQDTEPGSKQASDLTSAVDIRETTVSSQAALDIFRAAKAGMTPAVMLDSTRRMFSGDAMRAILVLPVPQPDASTRLTTALALPVTAATSARLTADSVTMADLPSLGKPGKVVSRKPVGALDMEFVTFANGVKMTLFANSAESGKVRINVRFGHGQQDLSPTRNQPNWAAGYILGANGIGKLGQRDLDELTNGRRLGFSFNIDDDAFELGAVTRPADYRDQLRLFATKLAYPGWDAAPIARAKAGLLAAYDATSAAPDSVLGRDLGWLLRNKDARFRSPDKAEIAALTPDAFRKLWQPILQHGPVEVQIFGDVKADDAISAVAETFGALPHRKNRKVRTDSAHVRFPAHNETPLILHHSGDADQAAATIAWPTASGLDDTKDARALDVLSQIISDRLFEKLRSVDGASYSPNAASNWPFSFENSQGYLLVSSQLKPERIDYFYTLIGQIAVDLATKPVSEDELARVIAPTRQMLSRASTGNAFWMTQMEGATQDPRYINAMNSLGTEMLDVTAADLQALAKKYLVPEKSYSVVVLPQDGGPTS